MERKSVFSREWSNNFLETAREAMSKRKNQELYPSLEEIQCRLQLKNFVIRAFCAHTDNKQFHEKFEYIKTGSDSQRENALQEETENILLRVKRSKKMQQLDFELKILERIDV